MNAISSGFAAALLLLGSMLAGCDDLAREGRSAVDNETIRERPTAVPAQARWVGGPDGGVYVLVSTAPEGEDQNYRATIYNEIGGIWYDGSLMMESPDPHTAPPPADEDGYIRWDGFTLWDGDTLYLQDGRRLVIPGT